MDRADHRRKREKILALASFGSWVFLAMTVGILFFAAWEQIWYWEYQPYLWGLTKGQFIVPAAVAALGASFALFGIVWVRWARGRGVKRLWAGLTIFATLAMTAGGGVVTYYAAQQAQASLFDAGPYLTWGAGQDPSTSIYVCWRTALGAATHLRYGAHPDALDYSVTSPEWVQFHKVPLTNLLPDTTYYYLAGSFPVKQFRTGPAAGSVKTFTFCVWADPRENDGGVQSWHVVHKQPNLPKIMAEHLAASGAPLAFSLCAGDITLRGVDFSSWQLWFQDITTHDFASNWSHVVSAGNHERHDDPTGRNFQHYYPYPQFQKSFNFSFTYGHVHVLVLDPLSPRYGEPGVNWWEMSPEQVAWAAADLQAHAAIPFKVVLVHPSAYYAHKPITWGGGSGDLYPKFAAIAEANGVDVVFSGHDHEYEVNRPNKVLWMKIGTGGNDEHGLDDSSYVQVDVNATHLAIQSRYTNGTWFDSYLISASQN